MIIPPNPQNFITTSPFKTNPTIYTLEWENKISYSFTSPAGFQYDRYFTTMFPDDEIIFQGNIITVYDKEKQEICKISIKEVDN